jgi:predicted HTH transcriptional regulator
MEHLTEAFLKMETPGELIGNLIMIGLLPAIGEELFFRGILQRIFVDWSKSKHWGVWITAIIFSAVHMQFLGFVPRLLLGALLGYLYVWSGSLWLPIIAHFVNNAAAVILTYIYSNDIISINPNNIGTDDENILPVVISALLCVFLLTIIYRGEKNAEAERLGLLPYDIDPLENDRLLVQRYEQSQVTTPEEVQPEEMVTREVIHPREVVADAAPKQEFIQQEVKKREEFIPEGGPLETALFNFALTDLSDEAQHEMITRMDLSYKLGTASYLAFLNQFGFIRYDGNGHAARPTGLGLLMLGKSPQLHFPQERIKFTIHREKEDPVIRDFEGPLVLMPNKIEEYLDVIVTSSINREQFHRVVLSEIPKKVLREVIINAIVHRDYLIEGARIMVDAFNDRVEVSSPGIPKFPIKKFYDCSVPSVSRNQKISYIFNQMHLVEERGLGMKELKSLKEEGNPPDFKLDNDIFTTIIYRSKKAMTKPEDAANLTEEGVKAFIKQKERISAGDYSKRFNVTTKTAQRHLNKLIEEGVVEKEGDKKGTKYFLKK